MSRQGAVWIGLAVWLAYCAMIFGVWLVVGTDYTDLAGRDVIVERLILPEVLGAAFIASVVTWLGWWHPVLTEDRRGGPSWTMWVLLVPISLFVLLLLGTTEWSAIAPVHVGLLVLATILIGFNEEVLTRGVLVVSARGSIRGEGWVWLISTGLFALMHLPNGLFGPGIAASAVQVVFTFLLGSGLYLLRRVSGGLVLPIAVHAVWDFSTFSHGLQGAPPPLAFLFQFLAYLVAIILVVVVLRHDRGPHPTASAAMAAQ